MISILTVTKRTGWEKIAEESLMTQTYQDFEWIVVTEEPLTFTELKPIVIQAPPKKGVSNLEQSTNVGLRECKGEYVVFYQDFIELEPNCLEKLLTNADKNTFVTTLTKNPEGDEEDPRYLWIDGPRPCFPEEWEINVGLAPMNKMKELGGFDEDYDNGWAWGNCNLAERAELLGCKFVLDESNRPQLVFHVKEPDLRPNLPLNGDFHAKRMADIKAGKHPLKCSNL